MSATAVRENRQDWKIKDAGWRGRLRQPLERLWRTQLRNGSPYTNIRGIVPALALGLVWFRFDRLETGDSTVFLNHTETMRHLLTAFAAICLWNLWLSLNPYLRRTPRLDFITEVQRLFSACMACSALLFVCGVTRRSLSHGTSLAILTLWTFVLIAMLNLGSFSIAAILAPSMLRKRAAILVGTGKRATLLRSKLTSHSSAIQLFGCVDDEQMSSDLAGTPFLGPISRLPELLRSHPIEMVLIGLPMRSKYDDIQRVVDICESVGVESHFMQDIFETERVRMQPHTQVPQDFNVLGAATVQPTHYIKRLIDLLGATFLLVLFSPVMLAAAIAIKLTSPGPALFVQQRYGKHRKPFPMFKFRSMVVDAELKQRELEAQNEAQGPVFKLKRDPRVTAVGAFLRKASIDELPQLFNVLLGDMSLVGPRPLPLRDVSRFEEPWLLRRFSVRPGLTCIWQVNGRSNTNFDSWIRQDLAYIDSWSLTLDLNILLRTIPAVLRGRGAV